MAFGIIVYKYEDLKHYVDFTMADDTIYDRAKESLLSKEGIRKYGMQFIAGKKGIEDQDIERIRNLVHRFVERKNKGEAIDLEKELEGMS